MKKYFYVVLIGLFSTVNISIAQKNYSPKIEPCSCRFTMDSNFVKTAPANLRSGFSEPMEKLDSSFKTECGYLLVPENRNKKGSRFIKLPFIVVKSKNPGRKNDPLLFTSGGPGNSSLG